MLRLVLASPPDLRDKLRPTHPQANLFLIALLNDIKSDKVDTVGPCRLFPSSTGGADDDPVLISSIKGFSAPLLEFPDGRQRQPRATIPPLLLAKYSDSIHSSDQGRYSSCNTAATSSSYRDTSNPLFAGWRRQTGREQRKDERPIFSSDPTHPSSSIQTHPGQRKRSLPSYELLIAPLTSASASVQFEDAITIGQRRGPVCDEQNGLLT